MANNNKVIESLLRSILTEIQGINSNSQEEDIPAEPK